MGVIRDENTANLKLPLILQFFDIPLITFMMKVTSYFQHVSQYKNKCFLDYILESALFSNMGQQLCEIELLKLKEIKYRLEYDIKEIDDDLKAVNKDILNLRNLSLNALEVFNMNTMENHDIFLNAIKYIDVMRIQLTYSRNERDALKSTRLLKRIQLCEIKEKISSKDDSKKHSNVSNYKMIVQNRWI